MPVEQIPEPWGSFLSEIDSKVVGNIRLLCIGGFALTMLYALPRVTGDVDVIAIDPQTARLPLMELAGPGSPLYRKYKVYLQFVAIVTLPENYEDRLVEMFPGCFANLRLYTLDPYDLALSKLQRNAQRDRDDVRHLARMVSLDLDLLRERYETELEPYLAEEIAVRERNTLRLCIEAIEEERGIR
jgi:Nucleotidyltransferase of unknown function (DUF6036)